MILPNTYSILPNFVYLCEILTTFASENKNYAIMANIFGRTWWGKQWLNSLTNIDYANRLPRGSAYARKGAVRQISFEDNIILAKVAGTRPRPYTITIKVPAFGKKEVERLIAGIIRKPVIISKLLNRELDPEVLSIARDHGLEVFPRTWADLSMDCSCPDWAVPCKHLAAVIYKVSAGIDNDPFLLFRLHGVDLPGELARRGIHLSPVQSEVPRLDELLIEKTTSAPETDESVSRDYSTLSPIGNALVSLLADAPVFYQESGNFREKYDAILHKAEQNARKILNKKSELNKYIDFSAEKPVVITKHTRIEAETKADGETYMLVDGKKTFFSIGQMMLALEKIPPGMTTDYQPSVELLYERLQLSLNLIANGAVVPQIVKLKDKNYAVRWLPALMSADVRRLFPTGSTGNSVSPFLTALVSVLSGKAEGDTFLELFFKRLLYPFNKPGEEALPGSINAWLQRYYLTQSKYKPVVVVDELPPNRFTINIEIEMGGGDEKTIVSLHSILTREEYSQQRFPVLQSLTHLSSFIPGLDDYINGNAAEMIVLDDARFTGFLMQLAPAMRLLDINILLPKSLQEILRPRASVRISSKKQDGKSFMRLDSLLDYDWQVAVGDTLLSEEEFLKLVGNSAGLIKYKANYIYVSPGDLEKLHKQFGATRKMSPLEILRTALSGEYQGAKIHIDDETRDMVRGLTSQPEVPLPSGLNACLRPYQERGFAWMYRNSQLGFGSVIADDMGLGKTLQVIAMLLKYKEEGTVGKEKALIIVPTGLLTNWQAEFEKFAPGLCIRLYHGMGRRLDAEDEFDVMLTSYGIARSDAPILKKHKWQVVITDEAQNIKNQDTAQSKAIRTIKANTFIAMSGTPVENRLSELWSIMDFANRGFLGKPSEFRETFADPIQKMNDRRTADKLKLVTAPFMMRRLKTDKTIISDLPDKIEIDSYAHLTKEQAGLYQKTLQEAMATIEGVEVTDRKMLFARQGLVLQMILALKQICNHPTHFLKNNVLDATLSGKLELLFDKLDSIIEAGEKVLVFTQFTEMGELLRRFVGERYGDTPLFYHGGCTIKQRKEMVDNFQNNRADKVFILSLKAAGTGLNLTAANHVIHYDLWWNPAVEAQATDRAYRIGQKNNVMVHRFITKGTFEERINEMIQNKKALADMTVATGENWIGDLTNKELKDLFELK